MTVLEGILLLAYLSLVVELVFFPVPSVASSYQLMKRGSPSDASGSDLQKAKARPLPGKLIAFVLPTCVNIALFLIPLWLIFFPSWQAAFIPLFEPRPAWMATAGAVLVITGRLITFTATLNLRRADTKPFRASLDQPLQTGFLFSRSRNPGLVGMYLFYAGLFFSFPNVVLLAGFVFYLLHMHHRILMEESHLRTRYGDAYARYLGQTPRYF